MDRRSILIAVALLGVAWFLWSRASGGGAGIREGTPAPEFALKAVDGSRTWSNASLAGMPYALVFSASWCPSCREEMPEVARLNRERPDLAIVTVSDEPGPMFGRWLADRRLSLAAAGDGSEAWRAFVVRSVPAVVVVDAEGNVAYASGGKWGVARGLKKLAKMQGGD
mgnify:CR=1 FL=1